MHAFILNHLIINHYPKQKKKPKAPFSTGENDLPSRLFSLSSLHLQPWEIHHREREGGSTESYRGTKTQGYGFSKLGV